MKYQVTDNYVQFNPENDLRFFMDHRAYRNVPDGVKFYLEQITQNGLVIFVGDGYGILQSHNLPGKYGNGSIALFKSDIEELINEIQIQNYK